MLQEIEYIPIEKSKLYRIGRRKDLAKLLGLQLSELKALSTDNNYKEWTKKQKGKKDRLIEEPLPRLGEVLARLHIILAKVETPSYLMSGKKRIKPRDNAEIHRNNKYMINVDIERFYQTTKREFIYSTFKNEFEQADDVASALANLVTYKGHIPTGTATSQLIAFWAYKKTFDRVSALCESKEIEMSVWVDDITFSSQNPLPQKWVQDIEKMMRAVDLGLKTNKTKKYGVKEYKTATGVAISPEGELFAKNAKRKEIIDALSGKRVEQLSLKESRQLLGKITSQRQNEPDLFENLYKRCKLHLRKLEQARNKSKPVAKSA